MNWFGHETPQYWDVCKKEWRCVLGDWVNDNERMAHTAQILDIRKQALKWYGPYTEQDEREQIAEAVLRFWPGPDFPPGAKTDRGPNVSPDDPIFSGGSFEPVVERYYAIINAEPWGPWSDGGPYAPDIAAPSATGDIKPVERGMELAKRKRLTEFGAVAPKDFRHLHPVGEVVQGEEYGLDSPENLYWLPYNPGGEYPIQLTWGGRQKIKPTLKRLSSRYSLPDYIGEWQTQQDLQIGIIAQRIAHTIGSAILAAIPVTSAWSAPVYAAGNALIDMQQSFLDADGSWVDAFQSLNEAGLQFLEVGSQQQIEADTVNAKVQNDGQNVTGGQYTTPEGVDAGGPEDTTAMQQVNAWAQASIQGANAAMAGDWAGVQEAFEQYGFDLPEDFLSDVVGEVSTIVGGDNEPYATTTASSVRSFTPPATEASVGDALVRRGYITVEDYESATGQQWGSGAPGKNTAVVLAVLGLIVGLAWVL